MHLRNDVHAVNNDRRATRRPKRHMQYGAILGDVDLFAAKHRVDVRSQVNFFYQFE
jgi:hypothetical protein